jgi:1-deoxy-D-xylulose-5-phosphate synthase
MTYKILDKIHKPADFKKLDYKDLDILASEVRDYMISVVSQNGGHLASSLGAVEITIALHKVFNAPKDVIVWDVGHQAYAHKILTGRKSRFKTLRQYQGISGFLKPKESKYDAFAAGHTSTSISAAMGFAKARDISGKKHEVIAVLGDASLANGMSLEAINNVGHDKTKLIVVVIDNEMSIGKTVGALSNYLNSIMTGGFITRARAALKNTLEKIPAIGKLSVSVLQHVEEGIKGIVSPGIIFDELGLRYIGPITEGHNIKMLVNTLNNIKDIPGPKLLHIITKKGKGYEPAEKNPTLFHGIGQFEKKSGAIIKASAAPVYSMIFSDALEKIAAKNKKVIAIVAAMIEGTNLSQFREKFPDRFFDVGIAEEHAVTFAGGLAAAGFKPVVAVYSTFMQRAFDQIIHDIGAQNLPVVFAMDRAGLVGEDGPTHHGVFDIAFMKMVPNMIVMAPSDGTELKRLLATAFKYRGPASIRFPRGKAWEFEPSKDTAAVTPGTARMIRKGSALTIVSLGALLPYVLKAADNLGKKFAGKIEIIDARFAKPLDETMILKSVRKTKRLITIEEGCLEGGFGQAVLALIKGKKNKKITSKLLGIHDEFVEHGTMEQLRSDCGLTETGISKAILEMLS